MDKIHSLTENAVVFAYRLEERVWFSAKIILQNMELIVV